MTKKIDSLEDLRRAQEELAVRKEITKRAFSRQIGVVKDDATGYLIKKVAIPIGISLVAAIAIKAFADSRKDRDQKAAAEAGRDSREAVEEVKTKQSSLQWLNYFNIFLSFLKIFQGFIPRPAASGEEEGDAPETDSQKAAEPPFTPRNFVQDYRRSRVVQD